MVRLAFENIFGGHIGYFAKRTSYTKKAMIKMMPRTNGASTCVLLHEYCILSAHERGRRTQTYLFGAPLHTHHEA
jgi:hypothetical protein